MDTRKEDFLRHYRDGINFRVASKMADATTKTIREWVVSDPVFAAEMNQIQDERIFEVRRALVESLPDIAKALIANAKGTKQLSISAARLVFQAAGVKLPDVGRPKLERREKAEPSKDEGLPEIETELEPDDTEELADIAKGIL